jgi:NAD(P)-dependent dehydrogenase (short-subunit alcohol dehydrogenase family)
VINRNSKGAFMLENQKVLCIGGSSGIGLGVAKAAIEAGADVVVTSRTADKAKAAAQDLGCIGEAVDIGDEASVAALFEKVGPFSHLIITAGPSGRNSFSETPPSEATRFMDGKVWAAHRCIWEARKYLSQDGSITLITGGYAKIITDGAGHVHTAFKAVEAMIQVAAVSLAPIRCNVLRPGFMETNLWSETSDEDLKDIRKAESEMNMIGRIVEPIEFGRFAVQLMQTKIITGAIIPVDGGRHLSVSN